MSLRALAVAGFLLLALLSPTALSSPTLLVLGDSISAAYGMSLQQGWVTLLEERLASEGLDADIINASISGETTAGGRRRLPSLLEEHQPDALVIELGGNDGLRGYPVDRMRSNLVAMATAAAESGARVLILPMEIPPNYGSRYTAEFRESFPAAAEKAGARLGPFILGDIATQAGLMQDDGIHPKPRAQAMIVDKLLPDIRALLAQ